MGQWGLEPSPQFFLGCLQRQAEERGSAGGVEVGAQLPKAAPAPALPPREGTGAPLPRASSIIHGCYPVPGLLRLGELWLSSGGARKQLLVGCCEGRGELPLAGASGAGRGAEGNCGPHAS